MILPKSLKTTLAALAIFSLCTTTTQASTASRVGKTAGYVVVSGGGLVGLLCAKDGYAEIELGLNKGTAYFIALSLASAYSLVKGAQGAIESAIEDDEDVTEIIDASASY